MKDFFGRLPITAKIVLAVIAVNLVGLAASAHFIDRTARDSLYDLAVKGWVMQSGQIASASAGGIKWKKPDVVADAYAAYANGDTDDLERVVAYDASGAEIASYASDAPDAKSSDATIKTLFDQASPTIAIRRLADSVVMLAPAGMDKSGAPLGYVGLVWDTSRVEGIRSQLNLQNFLVQTISTLALVLLLYVSTRWLVGKPLKAITGRIQSLSAGDLDTEVTHQDRTDEVGVIARALEGFRKATLAKIAADDELEVERTATEEQRQENEAARASAAKLQAAVVRLIGAALSRVAEGDLTARLKVEFPKDYQKLKEDFNLAMDRLQDAMGRIVETGEQVQVSTAEIRRAADELARRTEQQAVSVEETVAAVNEITASVTQTAAGAGEARAAVEAVTVDAGRGDQVVGEAIVAMGGIERSSIEINKIIGVIDEIAFQTNLLALNAGVEAARAGDAGRGFAVVAQEVRTLAQRSAEAAKEIKGFITTSTSQVKNGAKLVAETGEAIGRITAQVGHIRTIVTDIAASAGEQASSLKGINTAMGNIDTATQQNAAMAEQFTAASHNLARESQTLASLIGHFRTSVEVEAKANDDQAPAAHWHAVPSAGRTVQTRPVLATAGATALAMTPDEEDDAWQEF